MVSVSIDHFYVQMFSLLLNVWLKHPKLDVHKGEPVCEKIRTDSVLRLPFWGSHPFCTPALVKGPLLYLPKRLGKAIQSGLSGSHPISL